MDRVDVRSAVDAAGLVRATGNTVWWGTNDARVESFGAGSLGWQVRRDRFDTVLLAEAAEAGARVVRRAIVREVTRGPGVGATSFVHYDLRGRQRSLTARWVLDCTGRAGLLARREWRRADPAGRTLALAGVWERRGGWTTLDDETHTLVESYEGGWAWSVPVSRTRRYVTVMVDPAVTPIRRAGESDTLAAVYEGELAKATRLYDLVRSGRHVPELEHDRQRIGTRRDIRHGLARLDDERCALRVHARRDRLQAHVRQRRAIAGEGASGRVDAKRCARAVRAAREGDVRCACRRFAELSRDAAGARRRTLAARVVGG